MNAGLIIKIFTYCKCRLRESCVNATLDFFFFFSLGRKSLLPKNLNNKFSYKCFYFELKNEKIKRNDLTADFITIYIVGRGV